MKFDKERCFSALTADTVKIGSKGYFADNLNELQRVVRNENSNYFELKELLDPTENFRFLAENLVGDDVSWNLFYLVEEPKEKKYRPYKDTEEMIDDFFSRGCTPRELPLIWIKAKNSKLNLGKAIFQFAENAVYVASELGYMGILTLSMPQLLEEYTYLDGTPCGVEVECEQ